MKKTSQIRDVFLSTEYSFSKAKLSWNINIHGYYKLSVVLKNEQGKKEIPANTKKKEPMKWISDFYQFKIEL